MESSSVVYLVAMNSDIRVLGRGECCEPEELLACVLRFIRVPGLQLVCLMIKNQIVRHKAFQSLVQPIFPYPLIRHKLGLRWFPSNDPHVVRLHPWLQTIALGNGGTSDNG